MILIIVALLIFLGAPASSSGAAVSMGRATAQTGFAAALSWLVARNKMPPWSWLKFVLIYIGVLVLLIILASIGRMHASERPASPFKVSYSPAWKVERMQGLSSAASDQTSGLREQAMLDDSNGRAVIALTCAWLKPNDQPVLVDQLHQISSVISKGFEKQGVNVRSDVPIAAKIGNRDGLMVELHVIKNNQSVATQLIAVTTSNHCFFSAMLVAAPEAKPAHRQEFDRVRQERV